jgi:RsiW-degrading membrane proteinase PrsW (M82 family)
MMDNRLLEFMWAVVPILMYLFFVYIWTPKGYISPRRARRYLLAALISPMLVIIFHYLLPKFFESRYFMNQNIYFGYKIFIQTSLVEEVCKLLLFFAITFERRSAKYDLPVAIVYYAMVTSAGFAIIENISYLAQFGSDILFVRAITAVILHLICGVFMGYGIQIAVVKSTDSTMTKIQTFLHRAKYVIIGLLSATIFHGIYDLVLTLPFIQYPNLIIGIILVSGLIISGFMIQNVIRLSTKMRNEHYNKDIERK